MPRAPHLQSSSSAPSLLPSQPPSLLIAAWLNPKKRGSLEDQLAATARALQQRGVSTTIAFAGPPSPPLITLFEEAGAHWTTLDYTHPVTCAAGLLALARRLRPAIIHTHFLRPLSAPALAARATGAAVVHNEHLSLVTRKTWSTPLKRAVGRAAGEGVVRVAVSRHVLLTLMAAEGAQAERLRLIENGVDAARFAGIDRAAARRSLGLRGDEEPAIACVARMAPEKGVDVAIEALVRLRCARRPQLLIVGDGPARTRCEEQARALGVGDRVRFLGLRDDVERVLAASVQAWVPSRAPEAFGLAAAEAMAAGLPVVASRAGGLPEVVDHGATGLLVPPGDAAALAAASGALLANPARARMLGAAGAARVAERFSLARYVERLLALYQELVPAWRVAPASAALRR